MDRDAHSRLESMFSHKDDDELLEIVNDAGSDTWTPEAVAAAKSVLANRGTSGPVPTPEIPSSVPESQPLRPAVPPHRPPSDGDLASRFPALASIALIVRCLGWLVIAFGALFGLYWLVVEPNQQGHHFGMLNAWNIGIGIGIAINGLVVIASGDVIRVLLAIEVNTRPSQL